MNVHMLSDGLFVGIFMEQSSEKNVLQSGLAKFDLGQ